MEKFVCGVDLGGTKIGVGIIDIYGNVLSSVKVPTNGYEGPDKVIKRINNCIEMVLNNTNIEPGDLYGIGIGVPGLINVDKGEIICLINIPGWIDVPIVSILEDKFKVPVKFDNDANAAALGEYTFGTGQGTKNFVYMTISTGIGGGVVINGDLYHGANSNAAELGHMVIDINGPRCNCGNIGCIEALASGEAIARNARKYVDSGEDSIIKELAINNIIKAEHVFEAAKKEDNLAIKIIDREAFYIGVGISNIMSLFNPEVIAIGGGVSNQWEFLYDSVMKTIKERALKPNMEICRVTKAKLGDNIGILGAAALLF